MVIALTIVHIILALVLITVVLLQSGKSAGPVASAVVLKLSLVRTKQEH